MVDSEEGDGGRSVEVNCEVIEGISLLLPVGYESTYYSFDVLIEQEACFALNMESLFLHRILDECQFIAVVNDGLFVIQDGYVLGSLRVEDGFLFIVFCEDVEEGFDEGGGVGGSGEGERRGSGEFVPVPPDELLLAELLLLFDLPLHIYYTSIRTKQ